eukprot:s567_g17.t1
MQVDPTYLDEAFAEFDLKKGSIAFPDLRPILEQEGSQPLSAEGHARFRRVLGLEVYTDAGFAPMKSTGRRSVSGTCFIFQQCVVKCFSRHQSPVTLSSCEAELVALQSGVQEGIGLLRTLGFVLGRLYPWVDFIPQDGQETWYDEPEVDDEDSMRVSYLFPLVVKTDSLSGKMLLEAADLQRKSRHIEIKVYWLRDLMDRKVLLLSRVPGTLNPADCFTKCLPIQKFLFYRNMLGFVKVDFSSRSVLFLTVAPMAEAEDQDVRIAETSTLQTGNTTATMAPPPPPSPVMSTEKKLPPKFSHSQDAPGQTPQAAEPKEKSQPARPKTPPKAPPERPLRRLTEESLKTL